jgi:putative chitinase
MDIFQVANAGTYTEPLRTAANRWGITAPADQARWLAQVSVESAGFARVSENLNYSAGRLLEVFRGRNGLSTLTQAVEIVSGGPDAVAEAIYGGSWGVSHLGNTEPGDGAKFPGHGLIQLTGRWNHRRASLAIYGDDRFVTTPELLTLAEGAAQSAAWFWHSKSLNGITDIAAVTRAINGGLNGLLHRQQITAQLLSVI